MMEKRTFANMFQTVVALVIVAVLSAFLFSGNTDAAYQRGFDAGYTAAAKPDTYEAGREQRLKVQRYLIAKYELDAQEATRLADYFTEFADEFDVDPKLLAAQAHAESRFVNGAVSEDGAIGLMQIMPKYWATGQLKFIKSAKDLTNPRLNIRAGAAILRHYTDIAASKWGGVRGYHGGKRGIDRPMQETVLYVDAVKTKYELI